VARAVLSASLTALALVGVGAGELDEGVDEPGCHNAFHRHKRCIVIVDAEGVLTIGIGSNVEFTSDPFRPPALLMLEDCIVEVVGLPSR
jgi:hypothetical protein